MARPAELHRHVFEIGKALIEFLPVYFRRTLDSPFANLHARKEAGARASDDAVAALLSIDPSHGGAHGVCWRYAPAWLSAQFLYRLGAEMDRHRSVEENVHEPLPGKAEAFQMAVIGEDYLASVDAVFCR